MKNEDFIKAIAVAAIKHYPAFRILPSLTIAQAILESRWGKSGLAKDCYNYFGMKWSSTCGTACKEYATCEQTAEGVPYTIKAKFRRYSNLEEGIAGYYKFLGYPRYSNLKGITDYREACELIRKDGWATDTCYSIKLVELIQAYKLWKYDLQAVYAKGPEEAITPGGDFLAIIWLQDRLNGCLKGKAGFRELAVDGIYGEKTRTALLLYWKKLGWNKNGVSTGWEAGNKTRAVLAAI
ncbi:glucosaminidase domain-containing protein [Anaerocolumna xylanovorans]|uniref:Flagellum-specific peptidoglycan hydrolase FlgJ n=1 Tax=Anaerocolumna xylanovorans DSM 12503 TaxID=1121345 RepID=A0A1M7Y6A2_9FIRM|nr:glucosaminidase domain-containing protein [Anaerocolumna xylanovorans]SHO48162.1 Flagellum-specific peptidoglycan hydrolase FlgJ [Anaerocolumna xylanovorans DSM 12503]